MAINFDKALGIHEQALMVRAQRNELIAANIANADTPNYKARDIDFRAALASAGEDRAAGGGQLALQRTSSGHLDVNGQAGLTPLGAQLQYRVPSQPRQDGNTVEAHVEQTAYAENAMRYQASLQFLGSKFSSLKNVISGGR